MDGTSRDRHIIQWQTEETIVGTRVIPEGTLVLRHIEVIGDPSGSWLSRYGRSHYLIRNSCLYFLDTAYSWNEQEQQLTPEFRAKLLSGQATQNFCFPLTPGKRFGPDVTPAKVVGIGIGKGFTPASVSDKAYQVDVHLFDADTTRFWFEKGVGITGEWDWHRGHYTEYRVKLLKFEPAGSHRRETVGVPPAQ